MLKLILEAGITNLLALPWPTCAVDWFLSCLSIGATWEADAGTEDVGCLYALPPTALG